MSATILISALAPDRLLSDQAVQRRELLARVEAHPKSGRLGDGTAETLREERHRVSFWPSCSGSPLLVLPQVSVERTFVPWLPIIAEGKHSYDLEYQLPTEAP